MTTIGDNHSVLIAVCKNDISKELMVGMLMEIEELKKSANSSLMGIAEIIK
jgi:hypothetical protein